jgi:hypothetical protein
MPVPVPGISPLIIRFRFDVDDLVIERVVPGALLVLRAEEVSVGSLVEEDALVQKVLRHRWVLRHHRHVQHVLS